MPFKWMPPDLDGFIAAYQSGKSRKEMSRAFGVTPKVIHRVLSEAGIPLRNDSPLRVVDDCEISRRYLAGESEQSISVAVGVSRPVVHRSLLRSGIAMRNQVEANRLMMSLRSPDDHRRNSAAAHAAVRGKARTIEELCARALTRQRKGIAGSHYEATFAQWLADRGIECVPQQAIGPYNTDLGAAPVAVEIHGGSWHARGSHAAKAPKRFRYILDHGWNVLVIWADFAKYGFSIDCADYAATFIEESRADPSFRGQYRVIWSDGKAVPASRLNFDYLTFIPPRT